MNTFRKRISYQLNSSVSSLQQRITTFTYSLVGAQLLLFISGCSSSVPEYAEDLVSVSGTVTVDSQPIEGAVVTFVAQTGPSRSSSAVTDAEGNYVMETLPAGPGVLPGSYAVVISKLEMPDGSAVPPDVPPMDVGATEQLPDQFSSFASPSLTAEVGKSGGMFPFDLNTM